MIRQAILLSLLAMPAQAFTASNNLRILPTGEGAFQVPYDNNVSPTAFWCAAGEYVLYALGQPQSTRIYRTSPLPRHSGEGMAFALSPAASVGKTGLITLGGDDSSVSAGHAQVLCSFDRK